MRSQVSGRSVKVLILVFPTLVGIIFVVGDFVSHGISNESVVASLLLTARIALVMFLVAFVSQPLFDITRARWSQKLVKYRKFTGLSFALAMSFHLTLIATLFVINAPMPPPMIESSDYILGGPGLLAILVLAVTSNNRIHRSLGPAAWRAVHLVAITWIWLVFFFCLLLGAPARGEDTASPYLSIPLWALIIAMGLRLIALPINSLRGRRARWTDISVIAGTAAFYLFVATRI